MRKTTLNNLPLSHTAIIDNLNCNENIKRRLLDLGLIKESKITAILRSPSGGVTAFDIRGTLLALRDNDSSKIDIII